MHRPLKSRIGFTLIELLIAIAIIAVLIGILLPAVQKVREAAARMACMNNLKQMGLALHNHHDVTGTFPSGGVGWWLPPSYYAPGQPHGLGKQTGGWGFQILPFLEQDNLYRGAGQSSIADCQIAVIRTPVKVFFCPTRRTPQPLPVNGAWYGPSGIYGHAPSDYAATSGNASSLAGFGDPTGGPDGDGVIGYGYIGRRMIDIPDGTSSTMLLGEKRLDLCMMGQYQVDDNEGYTAGWDWDMQRPSSLPPRRDARTCYGYGENLFGSSHPSGISALMADGSVRGINYNVSAATFRALGTRASGEIIVNH